MTLENPLVFYPKRLWETVTTHLRAGLFYLGLIRARRRVMSDPHLKSYMDDSLRPVTEIPEEEPAAISCSTKSSEPGLISLSIPNSPVKKRAG